VSIFDDGEKEIQDEGKKTKWTVLLGSRQRERERER
jgi:hypothetical protein